jgi:NADPH:quinone reductase-like Zn-dependent oxidoreductase
MRRVSKMKLYRLSEAGSLDNLSLREEEQPSVGPDDVLVRIHAVSLNARDLMMVFGPQPYGPKTDIVPVSDGAGEVVACGSNVTAVKSGTRVVLPFRPGWIDGPFDPAQMATDLGGAVDGVLAEYVAISSRAVVPIPDHVTYEQAATLPCAGVTAWSALTRGAALQGGSNVLVLGTGGVSIFALQIAKAMGCKVIATTSSETKAETLRALGADHIVNYVTNPKWDAQVRELTGGRGVDRVVEVGGAGSLPKSLAALAPEGEVALIGLLDNPMNLISPLPLMSCMGVVRGISVGSRADLAALLEFMHGRFNPKIDRVFGFAEASEALAYLAARQHVGKIVITF